jgi:nucleotidyltransferase substrate binding protein (TIGR01987 family)
MENEDIQWKQRFANYEQALEQFIEGVESNGSNPVNIIKEGIIHRFEFTHELAWKVMKDYLEFEGYQDITGSRSATKEAFNSGLIREGQIWMNMIESRNNTVHTYNAAILEKEFTKIIIDYYPLLKEFREKMRKFL